MTGTGRTKTAGLMTMGALVAALVVVVSGSTAQAATITGGDKGGADVVLADGDVVSGTFTNVGEFVVPAGATVDVEPGTPLVVEADVITIDGTLDGTGAGSVGGQPEATGSENGNPGDGDGAGGGGTFGGCVHGTGGGGGGYGGEGGDSAVDNTPEEPGAGGPTYGTVDGDDIDAGSGGGSGANHCEGSDTLWQGGAGGAGGASITLRGEIHLTGSILADGVDAPDMSTDLEYGAAAGGGGSGGGVLLEGTLYLDGTISAMGGDGGNTTDAPDTPEDEYANAGGGGGGGRIKLRGEAESGPTFEAIVDGGAAGVGTGTEGNDDVPADPGADGTLDADIVGIPTEPAPTTPPPSDPPAALPAEEEPDFTG